MVFFETIPLDAGTNKKNVFSFVFSEMPLAVINRNKGYKRNRDKQRRQMLVTHFKMRK